MSAALPTPSVGALFGQWSLQPLAVLAAVVLAAWYWRTVRAVRTSGRPWPVGREVTFAIGLLFGLWVTNGFAQAYVRSSFSVWTSQMLAILLVVPLLVLAGGPLQLARLHGGPDCLSQRFLRSRIARTIGNPIIGPALATVLSVVLFFGPLPGWAIATMPVDWVVQLVLLFLGAMIALPLVGAEEPDSSLRVGLSVAIGSFELVLDAIPGIALRLHSTVLTSFFDHRVHQAWARTPLHDQQLAGAILWSVAELLDVPFLALLFVQWIRADARDAAEIDAVLEAERISRGDDAEPSDTLPADPEGYFDPPSDRPWWLDDPAMQRRLGRPD